MSKKGLSAPCLAVVSAVRDALGVLDDRDVSRRHVVRVALSGGADSLALAAGLAWLSEHEPDPLRHCEALVVDHGLQPGSADVAAAAVAAARNLGLSAAVVKVRVAETGLGLEAAAREARYASLAAATRHPASAGSPVSRPTDESGRSDTSDVPDTLNEPDGLDTLNESRGSTPSLVLVGHTMDDQAETVLMGLARGSGTRSLAGMPARFAVDGVPFVRPLLGLRRETTVQACVDWGLTPWQDPMNTDPRFLRVRVRHEVMPVLDDVLGPGVVEALAKTAILAEADSDLLDSLVPEVAPGPLPVALLTDLPRPLATRLVRDWLAVNGVVGLGFAHISAVFALVDNWRGQSGVSLPGVTIRRVGGELQLHS